MGQKFQLRNFDLMSRYGGSSAIAIILAQLTVGE